MLYATQGSRSEVYIYNTSIGVIPWVFYSSKAHNELKNYMEDSDGPPSGGLLAVL